MEQKLKKKVGRPKKNERSQVHSIRFRGKEVESLNYVLKHSSGNKKSILHQIAVEAIEKEKLILEREEIKVVFASHIQKSFNRNNRLTSEEFNGWDLQFLGNYWVRRQEGEGEIAFVRRSLSKQIQHFPERIAVDSDNGVQGAVSALHHNWLWLTDDEERKLFTEKALRAEWYLYKDLYGLYNSREYQEDKIKELLAIMER